MTDDLNPDLLSGATLAAGRAAGAAYAAGLFQPGDLNELADDERFQLMGIAEAFDYGDDGEEIVPDDFRLLVWDGWFEDDGLLWGLTKDGTQIVHDPKTGITRRA